MPPVQEDPTEPPPQGGGPVLRHDAAANIQAARSAFVSTLFSKHCEEFISTALGIDLSTIQELAEGANLVDGSTVNIAYGQAAFPGNPELAAAQQGRTDATTGINGTTVAQIFGINGGLQAVGQYAGNTIFYSPVWFDSTSWGSGALSMYTIFHESLHLDGFDDKSLEALLKIPQAVINSLGSQSITYALAAECSK